MADFYGTIQGADAYNAARGNAAWASLSEPQKEAALTAASAYVDAMVGRPVPGRPQCRYVFPGKKTGGAAQLLAWPRTGAVDSDGNELPADTVPILIEYATYEAAAYAGANPSVLLPGSTISGAVVREKVGPIEQQFADMSKIEQPGWFNVPLLPGVMAALAGVMATKCPRYGLGIMAA